MSICPRCGTSFECGMKDAAAGTEPCWCTQLPTLPPDAYRPDKTNDAASRCFCPYCLRALVAAQNAVPQEKP